MNVALQYLLSPAPCAAVVALALSAAALMVGIYYTGKRIESLRHWCEILTDDNRRLHNQCEDLRAEMYNRTWRMGAVPRFGGVDRGPCREADEAASKGLR